jgi:hypothetical protein
MAKPIQILMVACMALSIGGVCAQENNPAYPQHSRYSIGVFAGELGYDVGVGAEIASPAFSRNKRLSVRLKGGINWLERYKAGYGQWVKYKSVGASLVYNFISIERCRMFAEGGPFIILPDRRFSKKTFYHGLNTSAGLEMFVINTSSLNMCYYFSLGIAYSKAAAESLESQPKFGTGFVFSNGFRFYF